MSKPSKKAVVEVVGKMDKNYRCPRSLKAMFALTGMSRAQRKIVMVADELAGRVERGVHSQLVGKPAGYTGI